jgi:hypothetical protein
MAQTLDSIGFVDTTLPSSVSKEDIPPQKTRVNLVPAPLGLPSFYFD